MLSHSTVGNTACENLYTSIDTNYEGLEEYSILIIYSTSQA